MVAFLSAVLVSNAVVHVDTEQQDKRIVLILVLQYYTINSTILISWTYCCTA